MDTVLVSLADTRAQEDNIRPRKRHQRCDILGSQGSEHYHKDHGTGIAGNGSQGPAQIHNHIPFCR